MPTIQSNGIELYYEIHSPSAPTDTTPLLLIMGLGLNSLSWQKNLAALSAVRPVIVFDNRGTGRSSKPDKAYSVPQMADDAAGLLEGLGIRRAHVFGFSLGSLIAQELALRFTWKIKGLILGASTAGSFHHIPSPPGVIATMVQRGQVDPELAAAMVVPVIYSARFRSEHTDRIEADTARRLVYPTPPYAYRRQMLAAAYHDTYDRLDQLPMPTLLVTGDEDVLVVAENSRLLARQIPRAHLEIMPGAGHYFTSEEPALTAQLVNDFLNHEFKRQAA